MYSQEQMAIAIAMARGFSEARAIDFWYDLEGEDSEIETFIAEAATVVDETFAENLGRYSDRGIAEQVGSYIFGFYRDNMATPSTEEIVELVVELITDKDED